MWRFNMAKIITRTRKSYKWVIFHSCQSLLEVVSIRFDSFQFQWSVQCCMEMECTPIPERDLQFGPPKRNRIGADSARKNEAINPSITSIKPILGFNTKKCQFQVNLPCCWIQPVLQSSIPFYLLNLLYHSIISLSWRKQLDQVTSQATSQPTSSSSSRKRFRSRS